MITWIQISFVASGEQFRPSELDAPFTTKEDPGETGTCGRYRGLSLPQGSATFDVPESEKGGIRHLHALAYPWLPALRAAGATDFFIHITYHHDEQCTLGFDAEELRMLAEFGCPVSIDCWKDDKNETIA